MAFADARIELLGDVAGYNRFEALGRLAHLWRVCTQRKAYVVSTSLVIATLGPKGVEALLESELGERADEGRIRVRGTEGRIEWLEAKKRAAAAGGEANRRRLASHPLADGSQDQATTDPTPSPLTLSPSLSPTTRS